MEIPYQFFALPTLLMQFFNHPITEASVFSSMILKNLKQNSMQLYKINFLILKLEPELLLP
jgi:hypothetical protein